MNKYFSAFPPLLDKQLQKADYHSMGASALLIRTVSAERITNLWTDCTAWVRCYICWVDIALCTLACIN